MSASWIRMIGVGLLGLAAVGSSAKADEGWIDLIGKDGFEAWKPPLADWKRVDAVRIHPDNPKRLAYDATPGPIIVNGPIGLTTNIVTKQKFGDIEAHFEFYVPKNSNSGVKFHGHYEIQIADSWGVKTPTASDCGGIYPRAELLPKYHHIDKGIPPKVIASKPPGEWQTFDVIFQAPRFDSAGKKVADARIVKAVLNGQAVQSDVAMKTPTGHAWRNKEVAEGPILIQADHGPVAFRNVRVRPWHAAESKP